MIRKEKATKNIQIGVEVKLLLFSDNVATHMKNPKEHTHTDTHQKTKTNKKTYLN